MWIYHWRWKQHGKKCRLWSDGCLTSDLGLHCLCRHVCPKLPIIIVSFHLTFGNSTCITIMIMLNCMWITLQHSPLAVRSIPRPEICWISFVKIYCFTVKNQFFLVFVLEKSRACFYCLIFICSYHSRLGDKYSCIPDKVFCDFYPFWTFLSYTRGVRRPRAWRQDVIDGCRTEHSLIENVIISA